MASVKAQTMPAEILAIRDDTNRGAGAARNQGILSAQTPFVAFLDADDTLRPDFAAQMIARWQVGHYVYCDDWQGESIHHAPDCGAWQNGSWHSISALVPTSLARAVGGFDEDLPGVEDLDFYLKLQAAGVCGIRCPEPLLYYTLGGKRSADFKARRDNAAIRSRVYQKYIGRIQMGSCCGGDGAVKANSPNLQEPGDVLVQSLYTPMKKFGPATGREYQRPRGVDDYRLYVAPEDAEARPDWWQPIARIDPLSLSPDPDEIQRMALEALGK